MLRLDIENQLDELEAQLATMRAEMTVLRRRDETVKLSMQQIDEELRLAARLQRDFLPKTLPQVGNVHFHVLFRPAGYVSGDLYDVMRLDETHVGIYLADAVGHGMPAALLTMFLKNTLVTKRIVPGGYRLLGPDEALAGVNEALIRQELSHATFATALYSVVDVKNLAVSFARGGHPCPLVLRADGSIDTLPCDGSLLGIFPDEQFAVSNAQLKSGDRLMIYSDGIEVAFDQSAKDTEAWRGELEARKHLPAAEMLRELADLMDHRNGSLAPKDDLTIILMEVR